MNTNKTISLALLAGVATIASLHPAMALDAQAFAERIAAVYEPVGYTFEFGEAKLKDDTIVIEGAKIGIKGAEELGAGGFETALTFTGVTELADGGYTADTLTMPDYEADIEGDVHLSLRDIAIEGFYLPGGENVGFEALLQLYSSFSTGRLSVTNGGTEVVSIASMEAANTFNPAQGSTELVDVASTLAINGLMADLSSVKSEDPQAGAVIEGLGLTTITGDVTQSMTWTMADGRMAVDEFLIDFNDLGSFSILFDIAGLTPDVMNQMYAANAAMMAEGGDPMSEEAQAAQMMMGMQMAQNITITSAALRYDDASLAGKLISFFAQAQGIEPAQLVDGLKSMLPQMLAGTGIPALTDLVVEPVSAFLDDPQSLEVAVEPATPASLLVLSAAAANPAGLIEALGLTVTANQAAQ